MLRPMTTLRPVDLDADLDALFALAVACEAAAVGEAETTREDIHGLLTSPDADLVDGTRVAVDGAGQAVGFTAVEHDPTGRRVFTDTYVSPSAPDLVWDLLLTHDTAFAQRQVSHRPEDERAEWVLSAGCLAGDERYAAALTRAGLAPVRRFHIMGLAIAAADPPRPPELPDDVTLTVVGDDPVRQRIAHALSDESFSEHWHHVPRTFEDFLERMQGPTFDPSQWWYVSVDGEPAGVCLGDDGAAETNWAHVSTLGVLKAHRGRGLGTLLLRVAFADAASRGRAGVKLGVDTENVTGAPAVYAAAGMTQLAAVDTWHRRLG